jgi:hypothetical protein
MKHYFVYISILAGLFACTAPQSPELTDSEKEQVKTEIMELTTHWATANSNMDAASASEFWLQSPDMCHVENGVYFKNYDSVYAFLKNFYLNTDSMHVAWKERTILPLTREIALLKGFFNFRAVFKSGDVFEGEPAFTCVFVKRDGKWALIQGHESFAMNE